MKSSYLAAALCLLSLFVAVLSAAPPTANTGPGGFEATTGTSSLLLWFKADAITGLSDGNSVASWINSTAVAGAGSNATSAINPTYENAAGDLINSNPVVRFNGTTQFLGGTVTAGGPKTFFSVVRDTGTTGTCCSGGIATRTTGSTNFNGLESVLSGGSSRFFADRSGAGLTGTGSILNTPVIGSLTYQTTGTQIYLNGALDASNATNYQSTATTYQLGTRNNELGRYFRGDMAESLLFNRVLNTAERQIVENALSAKYSISLTTGDLYAGDTALSGDFDKGVFGIGRVDATNAVSSAGQAGLGIEASPANLDAGDFLLAGHRVDNNSFVPSAGNLQRSSRAWYVDGTGLDANDALTIAFDLSDAGLGTTLPDDTYGPQLIFSPTDSTFGTFSVLASNPTVVGDLFTFTITGAQAQQFNSNGFLTFAVQNVPEPATILVWTISALVGVAAMALVRRRRPLNRRS